MLILKKVLSFILAILIIAVIVSVVIVSYMIYRKNNTVGTTAINTETTLLTTTTILTTTENTTEATTKEYSFNDTAVVSKSQITLNDVAYQNTVYSDDGYFYYTAKDGCQYVLAYVTIKNIGNNAISFRWIQDDFYCNLITSDGLEYSPTTFFPYCNDSLENLSLNPLESKSGFIGFSVPNEIINSDRTMYLQCDSYPDKVKFKLN